MVPRLSRAASFRPSILSGGVRLILSVDDEPTILLTRQRILEDAGYAVVSAADGERALRIFAEEPIDLVLLDYLMPGMDGGMVAREMKARRPNVPIILVSASAAAEEVFSCANCRIDKGQGPALLLDCIRRFLDAAPKLRSIAQPATRSVPLPNERGSHERHSRK